MPNDLLDQLTALATSLRVSKVMGPTATELRVQIALPLDGKQQPITALAETVTQIVPMDLAIDLGWLLKSVRFNTSALPDAPAAIPGADEVVVGGMPVRDLIEMHLTNVAPPGLSSLLGTLDGIINTASGPPNAAPLPGVPGLLSRVGGTFQLPVQQTTTIQHPFSVDVQWQVMDNGQLVSMVSWNLLDAMMQIVDSGTGGAINPSPANALKVLQLLFPPAFVDLTNDPNPVVHRSIQARVRLTLQDTGLSSGWIDLPPVEVDFPAIPVPTCLLLCEHKTFTGRVVVLVPAASPLTAPTGSGVPLDTALATLNTALGALALAGFPAPAFAADLGIATTALGVKADNIRFQKGDAFPQLEDIVFTDFLGIRIYSAEDSTNSLIFFGPPNRQAQCFNDRALDPDQGQLNVTSQIELVVDISDLNSATPASNPAGRVTVPAPPAGMRPILHRIVSFAGEFSSIRFGWAS
jgi:hypothetical protein